MGQMQDRILDAIRARALKHKLDFVQQPDCSNVGTVYLMTGLTSKLAFHYDFQPMTATLQFYPEGKPVVWTCGFTDKNCVLDVYLKYEKIEEKMNEVFALVEETGRSLKK